MLSPGIDATLFGRDGITLSLAYDTAAAMLRWEVGKEDPNDGWWFHVEFGTSDEAGNERLKRINEGRKIDGLYPLGTRQ
jgi:hypothetical protein